MIPLHIYNAAFLRASSAVDKKVMPFVLDQNTSDLFTYLFENEKAARILYLPMMDTYHLVQGQSNKKGD